MVYRTFVRASDNTHNLCPPHKNVQLLVSLATATMPMGC